ncbi:hypothetical protein Q3O60_03465 [Alkalimonas collagenimarina]|uniref:Uncharacterized protein n=1 Tax=Alkalimonas collagenimarina TaxID=400390 RepID=A0ABT9GW09_9GAMM|nr:hypothetical protein [Alkalimonas collagenimarina]MDP4535247.1 hypothetical protein [Alkalimonas collagenimarina]
MKYMHLAVTVLVLVGLNPLSKVFGSDVDYSCESMGNTIDWRSPSTYFEFNRIINTITEHGCKYAKRKVSGKYRNDAEIIGVTPLFSFNDEISTFVACGPRTNVPMSILGAHPPQFIGGVAGYTEEYTVSENTPYELYQKDQSRRGTNRFDKWYSQWDIRRGNKNVFYDWSIYEYVESFESRMLINGRRNGESTFGPLTFKVSTAGPDHHIISTMTRGSRSYSFGFSGSFNGSFHPIDFRASLPSSKIEGESCYAAQEYTVITQRNTRPTIARVRKSSSTYTVEASDTHTTNDFLQYNWEFTGANGNSVFRSGRSVSASDHLFGNSVSVRVIVSDGNLAATRTQTYQLATYNPDPGYPTCPGCAIP